MDTKQLVYPMAAMVMLVVVVMLMTVFYRVRALRRGEITFSYLKTFAKPSKNQHLVQLRNHIENLFQVPVLFYAVCIVSIIFSVADEVQIGLAWVYVGLRVIHTLIHTTYNKVQHRFAAFVVSNITLVVLWVRVLTAL